MTIRFLGVSLTTALICIDYAYRRSPRSSSTGLRRDSEASSAVYRRLLGLHGRRSTYRTSKSRSKQLDLKWWKHLNRQREAEMLITPVGRYI